MIASFRHKGLKKLWELHLASGVKPAHARRLMLLMTTLDTANCIEDIDEPGYRLHPLTNTSPQRWSIHVNANWRLTFTFRTGNVYWLDYEDYH